MEDISFIGHCGNIIIIIMYRLYNNIYYIQNVINYTLVLTIIMTDFKINLYILSTIHISCLIEYYILLNLFIFKVQYCYIINLPF